ncbi:MAG: choice-of-anchor I family protein [Phormidesmis sp.]
MTLSLKRIGSFESETGAEIAAFDPDRSLLYVVSGDTTLQVLDLSDPAAPNKVIALDLAELGAPIAGANSIAYSNGLLAVALESETVTDPGLVALVNLNDVDSIDDINSALQVFSVGPLPDMITFTPDGSKVLVANEGEPDEGVDPDGSISIIDVSGEFASLSQENVKTADFLEFNGQEDALRADGVRIFPDAQTAQDVEPEYIAVSPDGTQAFVTLQEANAIAIVDIATATVTEIKPLGLKDFSTKGNGLDASDKDGGINIQPQPVFGLYMPDSIASFESNGETFYVIANEGDDRGDADEAGRGYAIRLKDLGDVISLERNGLSLDESFDESLLEDEALGRLTVSSIDGDTDGDGDLDQIVSYGGRSFSVLDSSGNIVFDSGDQIAQITAELNPELFNADDGDPEEFDARSDNKGAEPEAITTGVINGTPYAFVGLERAGGGILVYELSNPQQPEFIQYIRSDEDIAPEGLVFIPAEDSPNGQPLLTVANEVSSNVAVYEIEVPDTSDNFTLQLLHLGDQEAGVPALDDAPRASAVLNALREDYDNTLTLSSGDAIIPGVFFSASAEAYGGAGRADILIQNELGIQAIAFGNHEFDLGTGLVRDLIAGGEDDPETPDLDESFGGTLFPYLSSNLDFSTSEDLTDLVVEDDQAPLPNSIAATTVIDVNGEQIGVVGATTTTLLTISNPGDVTVLPEDFEGDPTAAQLDALAAEIQQDVDEMLAANPGLNKVVVLSHMQQIAIEQELAARLTNVDVIVAGGSNTRLADEDDRLRAGDDAQGTYPIFTTDAEGKPVAVVNTDGNYKYIGRLVIDFDTEGNVIPDSYDPSISGVYATDEQGIADLGAEDLVDPEVQEIVDTLEEVIVAKESNVFGISDVYLNGLRGSVRTEETNLGNLTADANLAIAQETDASVVLSLKNGGGIRDDIGQRIVPAGSTGEPELLPNEEIPGVKPAGGISETDIANTLSFNNGLTLLTITAEELLEVLEYGIEASTLDDENTQGRFPQVAGIEFSFDLTAQPGDRIQSLAIVDEAGNDQDVLVQNGELVGDPSRSFRMVTLSFLAEGGDGYPFPTRDVVNLAQDEDAARTGVATFAPDGSEQDALAEYLAANFDEDTPFSTADTSRAEDTRLQNLAFREDTVIDGGTGGGPTVLQGTDKNDVIRGTAADENIFGGDLRARLIGTGGNDQIFGEGGNDLLRGGAGDDLLDGGIGNNKIFGGSGDDTFVLNADGDSRIMDFRIGQDLIGLAGGLTFGQIDIIKRGQNALIADGDNIIGRLMNTDVADLTAASFTEQA